MIRRLLILLFVTANLAAQASTAYACEMMNVAAATHCCCHHGEHMAAQTAGDACCEQTQIADSTALPGDTGASVSSFKLPVLDPGLPLISELPQAATAPALRNDSLWEGQTIIASLPGPDVYLATRRLRL